MKILKIRFKNIHSLKGEFVVDFEQAPLSETGIFAIVGPTGSGKSTLLDVIMLGLFGQMPRFSEKISKTTVEKFGTVLTRGTLEAFAEIEYRTKGKMYRSRWGISVARTGKLRDYTMELAELPSQKLVEDYKKNVPARNEEIIGLNYEQFLKSIILAQGDFSKFLKSKPEERTKMLEKITGTEIYRIIGAKAYQIAKEYKEKLENKKAKTESFEIVSDEDINNLKEKKSDSLKNIESFKKQYKELSEILNFKKNIVESKKKIEKYEQEKSINEEQINEFEPFEKKISIHEKLLNLKTDLFENKRLQEFIKNTKEKIETGKKKIEDFELKINRLNEEQTNKKAELDKLNQKKEVSEPIFEQAKELTQKNELLKQKIEQKQSDFLKIKTQTEQVSKKKVSLDKKNKQLDLVKKEVAQWLENNKQLEELDNDIVRISQSVEIYEQIKKQAENTIEKSNFNAHFKTHDWKNYQAICSKLLSLNQNELIDLENNFEQSFSEIDLDSLLDKKISELQVVEKMIRLSSEFIQIVAKNEQTNKKLSLDIAEKEKIEEVYQKTRNEIEISSKKIEELEKKLERENLEAKYEQDRLYLEEEKPCPLCGAVHHPFAEKKNESKANLTKKELNQTKKQKSELEKSVLDISNKKSAIETNIENLKNSIEEENEKKDKTENEFNSLNKNIEAEIELYDDEKVLECYKKISQEKLEIQKQIKIKNRLQILNQQKHELLNINEKIDATLNERKKYSKKLKSYNNYFQEAKNNQQIIEKLKFYSSEYTKNIEKRIKIDNDISINIKLIEQFQEQLSNLEAQVFEQNNELQLLNENFSAQTLKLTEIEAEHFNNENYAVFHTNLNNSISQLKDEIADLENSLSSLNAQNVSEKNIVNDLQNSEQQKKLEFEQKNVSLLQKLNQINIETVEQALENILPDEKYNELKEKSKKLLDKKNIILENIFQTKIELEKFQETDKSDKTFEQINEEKSLKESQIEELNIEIGKISNKIENDNLQRKKLKTLMTEIDDLRKEADRWQKLNSLIGDSNGKVFAQIAQQFTLTHLITLANVHLKNFSKRYILDKTAEAKNNLFVYDIYQGMNKRSVHTLSGGETFLVSLSLALALSDLASQKTQIESLFIDEGFGTLDENTLDNALVNLEKLHANSERTIGLISHVADIKERISTKIILEKDNSGFSKLRVDY